MPRQSSPFLLTCGDRHKKNLRTANKLSQPEICVVCATPDALRDRADRLAREASRLRRKADSIEAQRADRARAATIAAAVKRIALAAAQGCSSDQLAARLQLECADALPWLTLDQARQLLHQHIASSARAAAAIRNRQIVRLALAGWDNARLAARFHLSAKHVSRLVAGALRDRFGLAYDMERLPIIPRSSARVKRAPLEAADDRKETEAHRQIKDRLHNNESHRFRSLTL
jgi:AraC-like DNA-binding protein